MRCERTGNPCGDDTWAATESCSCAGCRAWLAMHAGITNAGAANTRGDRYADEGRELRREFEQQTAGMTATVPSDYERGVADERARVVAWLRGRSNGHQESQRLWSRLARQLVADECRFIADDLEREEVRRG